MATVKLCDFCTTKDRLAGDNSGPIKASFVLHYNFKASRGLGSDGTTYQSHYSGFEDSSDSCQYCLDRAFTELLGKFNRIEVCRL